MTNHLKLSPVLQVLKRTVNPKDTAPQNRNESKANDLKVVAKPGSSLITLWEQLSNVLISRKEKLSAVIALLQQPDNHKLGFKNLPAVGTEFFPDFIGNEEVNNSFAPIYSPKANQLNGLTTSFRVQTEPASQLSIPDQFLADLKMNEADIRSLNDEGIDELAKKIATQNFHSTKLILERVESFLPLGSAKFANLKIAVRHFATVG